MTINPRNVAMKTMILAAAAAALALTAGCGKETPEVRPAGRDVKCATAKAESGTLPVVITAVASVEPADHVQVSTRMMGWVSKLDAREGDAVRKGQRLLSIDDADLRAKRAQVEAGIREAEAVVANAEANAKRFANLYESKAVSKQQLDDVDTGLARARAGLDRARAARTELDAHLDYLDIRAPLDGVVTRRMVEVGDMASPGYPLMYVDNLDSMKVVAHLAEKDVDDVSVGDAIDVDVTSLEGAVYRSAITRIVQSANPGSRTYDVEAYVPNPERRLQPGMFARALLPIGERRAVTVPVEAIVERGQLTGVFVVADDAAAHLRWVRLGDAADGRVEVLSGLTGDETVVVESEIPLAEGDKVVAGS